MEKETRELDSGHVFYKRMAELQEKIRKSEEECLKLEENFRLLLQSCSKEEDTKLTMLKAKYNRFIEDEKERRDRNDRILQTLERIESRTAMLTSKAERLQLMRRHYDAYMQTMYPGLLTSHQEKTAEKLMMMPSVTRSPRSDIKLSIDMSKDEAYPVSPITRSIYSPHGVPSTALSQGVPIGYSSVQPSVDPQTVRNLGSSHYSPQQENVGLFSNQPSYSPTQPGHLGASPYQTLTSNYSPNFPQVNTLCSTPKSSPYSTGIPYVPGDLRPQNIPTQNLPQDGYITPLYNQSLKHVNSVPLTVPSTFETYQEDVENKVSSDISDCINRTTELLSANISNGPPLIEPSNAEQIKHPTSVDFDLEQNTSGDPLGTSLSEDGVSHEKVVLDDRTKASPHIEENSSCIGVMPKENESVPTNMGADNDLKLGAKVIETDSSEVKDEPRNSTLEDQVKEEGDASIPSADTNMKITSINHGEGNQIDVTENNHSQELGYEVAAASNEENALKGVPQTMSNTGQLNEEIGYYESDQVYSEQQQEEYVTGDGQMYVNDPQDFDGSYVPHQMQEELLQQDYIASDDQQIEGDQQGYADDGQAQSYPTEQMYNYEGYYQQGDGTGYGEGTQGAVDGYGEAEQEYSAGDGQGYVDESHAYGYSTEQPYEGQYQQENNQGEGHYNNQEMMLGESNTQQYYENTAGTAGDNYQNEYLQNENYHESTHSDGNVVDSHSQEKLAQEVESGDRQLEEGNIGTAEDMENVEQPDINKEVPYQVEDSDGVAQESPSTTQADENTYSEQVTEGEGGDSAANDGVKDELDISENNTTTTSSGFINQNQLNELDKNSGNVSHGIGEENAHDRNQQKPKNPVLGLLESDSDSVVVDSVAMPNDDSDFDISAATNESNK